MDTPCGREGSKGSKGSEGSKGSGGRPSKGRGAIMIKPLQLGIARRKTVQPPLRVGKKRPPLVAGATTFAPVGSVLLDSQSPKGSLRIQFPCHPSSRGHYGCSALCHMTLQESVKRFILPPCIGGVPRSGIGDGERSEPISRMLFITYEAKEKHRAAFPPTCI